MKNLFLILLFPVFLFALGGDTLEYDLFVQELANGDTIFADLHYHPPLDSIQSIVNGRLGDINIAADANIDPSKLDSTKTFPIAVIRGDTVDYSLGIFDSVQITKATITRIFSTYTQADTIKASSTSGLTILSSLDSLIHIDSNGNMGLGLRNPGYAIEILKPGSNAEIEVMSQLTTGFTKIQFGSDLSEFGAYIASFNSAHALARQFAFVNNYGGIRFAPGFGGSNSVALVIDSVGCVGIDTLTPDKKLVVAGSARIRDSLFLGGRNIWIGTDTADTVFGNQVPAGDLIHTYSTNDNRLIINGNTPSLLTISNQGTPNQSIFEIGMPTNGRTYFQTLNDDFTLNDYAMAIENNTGKVAFGTVSTFNEQVTVESGLDADYIKADSISFDDGSTYFKGYNPTTFQCTLTGVTTTVTGTATYQLDGSVVTVSLPELLGTSNSTNTQISGIPIEIRMTNPLYTNVMVFCRDNSSATDKWATVNITSADSYTLNFEGGGNNWTASGTKGIGFVDITYILR